MIRNIIVEMSGDEDRLQDRILATVDFAKKNSSINIYSVIGYGHEYLVEKESKGLKNVIIHESANPDDKAMDLLEVLDNSILVSAGDTNSLVIKAFKKIQTIYRKTQPLLANTFPKVKGHLLVADIGATIKPDMLWVALVCRAAAQALYGQVKIGVLNIGEEVYKGEKNVRELNQQLIEILGNEFLGNKEIHIAVQDPEINALAMSGADGNKTIKAYEAAFSLIKEKVINSWWNLIGIPLFYILKKIFLSELDWRVYSGAWLLGIRKPILITHGRCDKKAFYNALVRAADPVVEKIWRAIEEDALLNKYFVKRK